MVSIHPIFTYLSFFGVTYGDHLPLFYGEPFISIIDTSSTPTFQHIVQITGNYSSMNALLNATISFSDDQCTNPLVLIEREAIDYNEGDEFLNIYFGAYNNESFLTQCGAAADIAETAECGGFVECIVFSPPDGTYDLLEFFVFQPDTVLALCGDDAEEEGPLRSVRVRFIVSCQAEIQCEEESVEDGEDTVSVVIGSSSESVDDAVRSLEHYDDHSPIYSRDTASQKQEIVPVHIDCKSYYNILLMIVLCICVCWIAQCALFCRYNKN